jgi:hypothetical protein
MPSPSRTAQIIEIASDAVVSCAITFILDDEEEMRVTTKGKFIGSACSNSFSDSRQIQSPIVSSGRLRPEARFVCAYEVGSGNAGFRRR